MPRILYVEGSGDQTFFQEIIRKFLGKSPDEIELELREMGGKPNLMRVLEVGLKLFSEFGVALDINTGSPSEVVMKVSSDLGSLTRSSPQILESFLVKAGNSVIHVIPLGLPQDKILKALGITQHSREDYLLKILFEDHRLTKDVPDFPGLLKESVKFLKEKGVFVNSSKVLVQLVKFILHENFNPGDRTFTEQVIRRGNPEVVQSVVREVLERVLRFCQLK